MELNYQSAITNAKQIVNDAALYSDELEVAYGCTHGISGWFKAFLSSNEFANLDEQSKKDAFESYEGLKWFLDNLVHQYSLKKTDEILNQDHRE